MPQLPGRRKAFRYTIYILLIIAIYLFFKTEIPILIVPPPNRKTINSKILQIDESNENFKVNAIENDFNEKQNSDNNEQILESQDNNIENTEDQDQANLNLEHPIYPDIYTQSTLIIRQTITQINFQNKIYNQKIHDQAIQKLKSKNPDIKIKPTILLIQVHKRVDFLSILLDSLKNVVGIESTLIIISSDVYDKVINDLIKEKMTFAAFQHIFYPYSRFFFPDTFPGTDVNDCPRDISYNEAIKSGCINALHPDHYKHYREAKYVQLKHHWYWKLQYTFKKILPLDDYSTHVILLEDDYYVTRDMLTTFNDLDDILSLNSNSKTTKNGKTTNYDANILSLGNYDKVTNTVASTWKIRQNLFDAVPFYGSQHNMGLCLNRKTFQAIDKCSKEFCTFDDYNWDWSINSLVGKDTKTNKPNCLGDFRTLVLASPRVLHLGACTGAGGTHLTKKGLKECDIDAIRKTTEKFSSDIYKSIDDKIRDGDVRDLSLRKDIRTVRKKVKPNGGFNDPRDHKLCLDYNVNGPNGNEN